MDSEKEERTDQPVYIRLPASLKAKVEADARRQGQTLSEWARRAFRQALSKLTSPP